LLQSSPAFIYDLIAQFTYFFHVDPRAIFEFTLVDALLFLKALSSMEEEYGLIQSLLIPLAATQAKLNKGKGTKSRDFDLTKSGTLDQLKNYFGMGIKKG
jgi:hypothetical protein